MKRFTHTTLRITVLAAFVFGSAGLPLFTHVCSVMGRLPLLAACEMEEAPLPACCSSHAADIPEGLPLVKPVACCHEHDVSQTLDTAARSSQAFGAGEDGFTVPTALHDAPSLPRTAFAARVLDDASPPGGPPLRLLHCTLLI